MARHRKPHFGASQTKYLEGGGEQSDCTRANRNKDGGVSWKYGVMVKYSVKAIQ